MKLRAISLFCLTMLFGTLSPSSEFASWEIDVASKVSVEMTRAAAFNWKVGDTLRFDMKIKPFSAFTKERVKETLQITKLDAEGYTMLQEISFKKIKQNIEILFDKDTLQMKRMRVNGKDQKMPQAAGTKIVKEEESHIKVTAGEYDCIHVVTEDKEGNQSQAWINPAEIPITGLLKSSAVAGIATVEMELTSFARGI